MPNDLEKKLKKRKIITSTEGSAGENACKDSENINLEEHFKAFDAEKHMAVLVKMESDVPKEIRRISNEEYTKRNKPEHPTGRDRFEVLSQQWLDFVLGFFESAPLLGGMADFIHVQRVKEVPLAYLSKICIESVPKKSSNPNIEERIYLINKKDIPVLNKKIEFALRIQRQTLTYTNSFVLSLIAQYEAMFSDLLKAALEIHPRIYISEDTKISAADVITSRDIEGIKKKIISEKVDEIQRDKHIKQIEGLFKRLKIDMPDKSLIVDFAEICERRNLITHANGVVNKAYIENLKSAGLDEKKIPMEGETLQSGVGYILTANARVALLGFWVIHRVWQKISPEDREKSIQILNSSIHDLLVSGYTKMARRLCQFALENFSTMSDTSRAYIVINRALTFHLEEDLPNERKIEGVEASLKMRDWSIINAELALALCCVKEEYDDLPKRIDDAVREGLSSTELLTWALFKKVKSLPVYREKMHEHFGINIEDQDDIYDADLPETADKPAQP